MGTHRVWPDAETAFVPASVLTKPAVRAALREDFELFFFFALPEYAVRNQERKGRCETEGVWGSAVSSDV